MFSYVVAEGLSFLTETGPCCTSIAAPPFPLIAASISIGGGGGGGGGEGEVDGSGSWPVLVLFLVEEDLFPPVSAGLLPALPLLPFSFLHKIQSMQVTSSPETFDTSVFDSIRQRADNLFFCGRRFEECSPSLELISTSNSSFPPSYCSVSFLAPLAL